MIPQRRLLYLDTNHLGAYLWRAGMLLREGSFQANEAGIAAFTEYMAKQDGSNFYLLADVAEEGFQLENLPSVRGADRRALVNRKLGQYFYGATLATTVSFGRAPTGRRDEIVLFTALTRQQQFEPWLAALGSAEAQLAGVYSLPLIGGRLLERIQPSRERCLLLAWTQGGIRQIFFENGQIRFSRLTPISTTSAAEAAIACAGEARKIYQYLLGQRMVSRGVAIPTLVIAHPAQLTAFSETCRSTEELQFQIVDLRVLCDGFGLRSLPEDSRCEALFLHLLASRPPREQFAPAGDRRFYRLWQARFALTGIGAVTLMGCLLFGGKLFHDAMALRDDTAAHNAQTATETQRYGAILKTFPAMPTTTDNLRAVINRFDDLEKRSGSPEQLFLAISKGLQDAPKVELSRIDWMLSVSPDEQGPQPDARRAGAVPAAAGALYAVAVIHGHVPTADPNDQRALLETINGFAASLRKDASLRITAQRLPFDIDSGKSLKSGAQGPSGAPESGFILRVSRKL